MSENSQTDTSHEEGHGEEGRTIVTTEEEGFIGRHTFLFIVLPAIIIGLFLIRYAVNACGSSTNSFCSTIKDISSGISSITSPVVNAWRNMILLACIMGGLLLGGAALKGLAALGVFKGISWLGGEVVEKAAIVEEALNEGKGKIVVNEKGKQTVMDEHGNEIGEARQSQIDEVNRQKEVMKEAGNESKAADVTETPLMDGGMPSEIHPGEEVVEAVEGKPYEGGMVNAAEPPLVIK